MHQSDARIHCISLMLITIMQTASLACLSHVSLMPLSCLSDVSLIPLPCLSHVTLMSLSCLSHVSRMSLACLSPMISLSFIFVFHNTCVCSIPYIHVCALYHVLQRGQDPQDALSCRSFFAKEPLIMGSFAENDT